MDHAGGVVSGWRAFTAGVVAGAILSVILALGRAFGLRIDFAQILGTMVEPRPTIFNWMLGYGVYLAVSGIFGLLYSAAFVIAGRAGWRVGALLGIGHAVIAGLLLGLASVLSPAMRHHNELAPGPFMAYWGVAGVVSLFALCIVFGALVGLVYRPGHFRLIREE
jgi:hypothetical protein